jgi:hypothetical protein
MGLFYGHLHFFRDSKFGIVVDVCSETNFRIRKYDAERLGRANSHPLRKDVIQTPDQ